MTEKIVNAADVVQFDNEGRIIPAGPVEPVPDDITASDQARQWWSRALSDPWSRAAAGHSAAAGRGGERASSSGYKNARPDPARGVERRQGKVRHQGARRAFHHRLSHAAISHVANSHVPKG